MTAWTELPGVAVLLPLRTGADRELLTNAVSEQIWIPSYDRPTRPPEKDRAGPLPPSLIPVEGEPRARPEPRWWSWPTGQSRGTIGGGKEEQAIIARCQEILGRGVISHQAPQIVTCDLNGLDGQPVCGGRFEVLIEPFAARQRLVICGAGHIALPLSFLAKILGFEVVLIDERRGFANRRRFPHVDHIHVGDYGLHMNKPEMIDGHSFVVIATPEHSGDIECLRAVIHSNAAYIGVIASHTKGRTFRATLKKEGVADSALQRISMPVGLDIGAQTPEEIAVAIAAEIIRERNQRFLNTTKFRAKAAEKRKRRE